MPHMWQMFRFTDGNSSSSSEENLEVSDEYLYSDYSDRKVVEGLYTNEPEYTKLEIKIMKFSVKN